MRLPINRYPPLVLAQDKELSWAKSGISGQIYLPNEWAIRFIRAIKVCLNLQPINYKYHELLGNGADGIILVRDKGLTNFGV